MINRPGFVYQPSIALGGVDTYGPIAVSEFYSAAYVIVDITVCDPAEQLGLVIVMYDPVADAPLDLSAADCSGFSRTLDVSAAMNSVATWGFTIGLPDQPVSSFFPVTNQAEVQLPKYWGFFYNTNGSSQPLTFSIGVVPFQRG